MNDLLDSIRAQIHARLSSPLFGAFLISWLCWNHRYLFILFSELPVQERFALAHSEVYPGEFDLLFRAFLWPLACSVVFILTYPYPSRWLFHYWHKRQVEAKKLRDEIEGETLLTKEESRKLILDALRLQESHNEVIESLNRQIDALRKNSNASVKADTKVTSGELEQSLQRIRELEAKLAQQSSTKVDSDPVRRLAQELQPTVLKILSFLAERENFAYPRSQLAGQLGLTPIRADYIFDKAGSTGLVTLDSGYVRLTPVGRDYVIEKIEPNDGTQK